MKLIDSKAELLTQEDGLQGIYKQIELAGRTCYKSEDKITDSSSVDFVKRMTQSGHTAMLEHGTIYLHIHWSGAVCQVCNQTLPSKVLDRYAMNPYSKVNYHGNDVYITTNMRVVQENGWLDDLKYLCEPTEFHERRITIKFTTDRGVSHELVRHRVFSFAQESTRYCNYSKDKFGKELTFVKPAWDITLQPDQYGEAKSLTFFLNEVEILYRHLINDCGWNPQQARMILPNCLKTEICMTGFVSDWKHFFDLRLLGTTGKPHPDMLLLAQRAKKVLEENDLWYLIYKPNEN